MKIAIVNDSPLAVESIRRCVVSLPEARICWTALNGRVAVINAVKDRPDILLMELSMPEMDGVSVMREIMSRAPCPILVVTSSVLKNKTLVFKAIGSGAIDAVDIPAGSCDSLLAKIRMISLLTGKNESWPTLQSCQRPAIRNIVAIGASAGGPDAVLTVLKRFPKKPNWATLLVQHIDTVFVPGLAEWLASLSSIETVVVWDRIGLEMGKLYLAGCDDHLTVASDGEVFLSKPGGGVFRPSVDELFASIAANWKGKAAGVILTGIGRDGAQGLLEMRRAGFYTVAQSKASSTVFGMPSAALAAGGVEAVLPVEEIAEVITGYFQCDACPSGGQGRP